MKRSGVIFAVKIAVLALLDAGTIALLFFPRSILADALFPWMAANVLLALFLINLLVLALPVICTHLRVHSAAPPILIALLYFVFTLAFTYLTRSWIDPVWYSINSLLALGTYCLHGFSAPGIGRAAEKTGTAGADGRYTAAHAADASLPAPAAAAAGPARI